MILDIFFTFKFLVRGEIAVACAASPLIHGTDLDPATDSELKGLISALQTKIVSDLDGISNNAAKNFSPNIINCLTLIINDVLSTRILSHKWKQARVILIKKPNKPKLEAGSYRPISLLPTLRKLTERVILSWLLEQCKVLYSLYHSRGAV